ncbi:MAG: hypothetical protein JWM56_914 [Candidatus Peribacteria bacterium]|nr:hypothetical protein [Candidatus Peribacteria bacterium]
MATYSSTAELRNMDLQDLLRDIRAHEATTAQRRLHIELKKEKNSALYRFERRYVARLKTIYAEKMTNKEISAPAAKEVLKPKAKTRTVRAPKKS